MPYLVLLGAILLLAFAPTLWVKYVMAKHNKDRPDLQGTGGELAEHLIEHYGLDGVKVAVTPGGDCYDPDARMVYLSKENYEGRSVTAVAVAAHEVSHAMQHHERQPSFMRRNKVVLSGIVVDRIGSVLLFAMSIAGSAALHPRLMLFGFGAVILMGLARVASQLVTLPVETDASFNRALPILTKGRYLEGADLQAAREVLKAAAYTYVAATIASVLNIMRFFRR